MSSGLYSGVSGLALGTGLYRDVSGLWSGASGLIAGFDGGNPYSGASLYLDFLTMTAPSFDTRITFSRGSNATLVDSTGKITYAPANLLTYSALTGGTAGTLGSGAVAPTGWSFVSNTGSISYPVAVGGNGTACRFVASAQRPFIQQNYTLNAYTNYIYSVYVDAVASGSSTISDNLAYNGLPAGATVSYYVNGVPALAGAVAAAGTRISLLFVVAATGGTINLRVGLGCAGSVTGDVTLSNPQLEPVTYQTTPSTYQATTSSAYYGPRFDYDPVTLAPKGLLIEEQRANLLTGSADFTATYWPTATNIAVAADNAASPDGTTNADKLTDNTTAGVQHRIYRDYTFASAAAHTLSVYAKRNDHRWFRLFFYDGTTSFYANFDLLNGAVGSKHASATSTITAVGNGWYRCTMTATVAAAAGNVQMVMLASDDTGVPSLYTGTGTSLWLYGAQLEAGAFATSYIPTVASTVTRSADVATMTGANFSAWFNAAAGTFVASFDVGGVDTSGRRYVWMGSDAGNTRLSLRALDSAINYPIAAIGTGSAVISLTGPALTANTTTKVAVAYGSDMALVQNGGTPATSASAASVSVTSIGLGSNAGASVLNGHIRSLAYYNVRLPNAQLQSLTT